MIPGVIESDLKDGGENVGKTIRISDADYEKAAGILKETRESMADLFSRGLELLLSEPADGEPGPGDIQLMKDDLRKILKRTDRIFRTVCALQKEDADDPDLGIGLMDVYADRNKHPEKYGNKRNSNENEEAK